MRARTHTNVAGSFTFNVHRRELFLSERQKGEREAGSQQIVAHVRSKSGNKKREGGGKKKTCPPSFPSKKENHGVGGREIIYYPNPVCS